MPLDKKKITQKELKQIAEQSSSSYTGSTINVKNRTRDHERNGRDGVLYYAKTTNMRKAEDRLLKSSEWPDNRQKQSNQKEDKGYVYVIKDKTTSTEDNLCDQLSKMNIK